MHDRRGGDFVPLKDLETKWDDLGVQHSLTHSPQKNLITVHKVVVPKGIREGGIGTRAMQALTEHADKHKQRVALTPSNDFGGNKNRLVGFYKRFGFEPNAGRGRDLTVNETMIREPNKVEPPIRVGPTVRDT